MQFIDLAAQQSQIRSDIEIRIKRVLDHGTYIMGPEVAELENILTQFTGAKHCITCASGTDALLMALMTWGVKAGDAVFVPCFSFFATAEVVGLLGATPVMVDIEPDTFNISPQALEKAIEAVKNQNSSIYPLPQKALEHKLAPRAIIPVDLFGQPAEYKRLLSIAAKNNLLVLEDAAQAFGAEYCNKKTCSLGCHMAATSFFPAKPLGCYGDGGAIFTDDDTLADTLRSIRVHGKGSDKYDNVRIGVNGRLDTLQAAILLAKMEIFPKEIRNRQVIAEAYADGLKNVEGIKIPVIREGNLGVWAQYSILVSHGKRDALALALKSRGIPTNIYYPAPMHMLAVFKELGYMPEDMPIALASSGNILALPFHPYLTMEDVQKVVGAISEAMNLL